MRAQVKRELATMQENSTMYNDIVRREIRIFRAKNGVDHFEAMSFPYGQGVFDIERPIPVRFKEYREHHLRLYTGQFAKSFEWSSWALSMEKYIEKELINELATERYNDQVKGSGGK